MMKKKMEAGAYGTLIQAKSSGIDEIIEYLDMFDKRK